MTRSSAPQEKVCALEVQAHQLGLQASQEAERMTSERTLALQMLQKVGAPSGPGSGLTRRVPV